MNSGYEKPLYLLPFDHRHSYVKSLFKFEPPLSAVQAARVSNSKRLEGDQELNRRQAGRLKQLSDHCKRSRRRFMFELLVPGTEAQLLRLDGDKDAYDRDLRPMLMQEAIRALQNAGVEPAVWKVEGLTQREHCERVVAAASCDGRDTVGCIVVGWQAQTLTRAEAVSHIAGRLREWVDVFEAGQVPHRAGPG